MDKVKIAMMIMNSIDNIEKELAAIKRLEEYIDIKELPAKYKKFFLRFEK